MKPLLDPKIVRKWPRLVRSAQYRIANFGACPPDGSDPEVYRLRPWYHDFSALGVKTNFDDCPSPPSERAVDAIRRLVGKGPMLAGSHSHQHQRDRRLVPLLEAARQTHAEHFRRAADSFLDTMSADGYYAFYAVRRLGLKRALCIDLESEHIERGQIMRRVLGTAEVRFVEGDVFGLDEEHHDIGLNSGGLYHLDDPARLLRLLRDRVSVLVVLSTVSQRSNSPGYKVTPVPGWQHGSAFSREWLSASAAQAGWRVRRRDGFAYDDTVFDGRPEGVELLLCV